MPRQRQYEHQLLRFGVCGFVNAPPFIVFGLPRSRTYWLSRYLSYGEWSCGHEEIRHARSVDDVKAWFSQPLTGTVETAAGPWWRLIQSIRPDIRIVVIRRPVDEVVESLVALGFERDIMRPFMRRMDTKLDQIEHRVFGVLSIRFRDMADEHVCAEIFEHCLPYRHDPAWWAYMAPINMQIDMRALVRYFHAYQPQLDKVSKIAKHQIISGMARHTPPPEGVTIQQEPFDTFFRDGQALFAEHLMEVGEAPDNFWNKNVILMSALDQMGAMQITTARSNGRMFGYLMAIISPSLESPGITSAMHTIFYASKDFPGLGMKLQRASTEGLRGKGVGELFLRAGVRGSGPKMGALYRRLGAEDFGQLFKLELKAA